MIFSRNKPQSHSISNPGPQNRDLVRLSPNSNLPPITPCILGTVWHSFDLVHRRVQEGGWSHQVTQREIPFSKENRRRNMRIDSGGFREAHWHVADEWAYMLTGKARITVFDAHGSMFVDDVAEGDLWNFPAGLPHSIQGLGEEGCEFLLVFNQGSFSEESTFLLSDWLMHTPERSLPVQHVAAHTGLSAEEIAHIPPRANRLVG